MRRRVRTCQTMRNDSAQEGGSSSVLTTSSDTPMARRSKRPRIGSRSRKARITKNAVTKEKMMNGQRHPTA